jgi:nucleoside-diphosphate-sugar epimerase
MIHGPGNKGNLNLLYKIVFKGLPWPLGAFENKRSFCSIDNLCFIINELIDNNKIPSGIYNVADDEAISTNELISLIAERQGKKSYILKIPKFIISEKKTIFMWLIFNLVKLKYTWSMARCSLTCTSLENTFIIAVLIFLDLKMKRVAAKPETIVRTVTIK